MFDLGDDTFNIPLNTKIQTAIITLDENNDPLHPYWYVIHHNVSYDLEDFAEWGIDLKGHRHKQLLKESPEGRNATLFDTIVV